MTTTPLAALREALSGIVGMGTAYADQVESGSPVDVVVQAAAALFPEPVERGAHDTVPTSGTYVVDHGNGHVPLGNVRVAFVLDGSGSVEVGPAHENRTHARPAVSIRGDGGTLIVRPGVTNLVTVEVEGREETARVVAANVAEFHGVEAHVAERILDAYLDPEGGRAHVDEARAERTASTERVLAPLKARRHLDETGRSIDEPDRCAEWCYLDSHDGPCLPRLADHALSPGGRIALGVLTERAERGHGVHSSSRTESPFVASGTLAALAGRGVIEERTAGEWFLTPLGHGIVRYLAIEAES